MSHIIVDLATGVTGIGSTGSPYNPAQFSESLNLTGITGDTIHYQVKGKYTWDGVGLTIKRDKALIESVEKTPARLRFATTGTVPAVKILNQGYGQTDNQSITLNKLMLEREGYTGATGDRGALIAIDNQGLTGKATNTTVTINNSVLRVKYDSGFGYIVHDGSTGDGNNSLSVNECALLAAEENVTTIIKLQPKTPCTANINSTYFEGHSIPLDRQVTGAGDYRYSAFYNQLDVLFNNAGLVNFTYVSLDNTVQYASLVDLSSTATGDTFVDSAGNPYTIVNVWDGLNRLQLTTITGEIDDTTPTNFKQGSIIKEYRAISVGIGGTGGGSGAIPAGINNKDNRFLASTLEFSDNTITGMTLPVAVTPVVSSELIGQGDPALGLTQDLFSENRNGTPDIGVKEYKLLLNTYETMPERNDVLVKSTINKTAVIDLTDTDPYFDSTTELKKVEIWYVHEDGRQQKHLIHEGGPGGPLTCLVKWTTNAQPNIWHKTRIKVIGFNGEDQMVRGKVIDGRYEDLLLQ